MKLAQGGAITKRNAGPADRLMGDEVRVVEDGREVEHIVYDLGRRQQISLAAARLRGQTPEAISRMDDEE